MSVMGNRYKYAAGFSLIELMVVVMLIALLATSVVWADTALIATTKRSRDSERSNDMKSVALIFERYYRTSPTATGSSYPTTQQITTSVDSLIGNAELLTPPSLSSPVFLVASTNKTPQTPTVDQYIYQPFNAYDGICTSTPPCVRYVLYYRTEATDEIVTIDSEHQQ